MARQWGIRILHLHCMYGGIAMQKSPLPCLSHTHTQEMQMMTSCVVLGISGLRGKMANLSTGVRTKEATKVLMLGGTQVGKTSIMPKY